MRSHILLVDDNDDILSLLSADLGEQYDVATAGNGRKALDFMQDHPVELVISDVMMPVMTGFQLCREIKTDDTLSHIPVILLTAMDTLDSRLEGLELGADAYIDKPFSPEHIQAQVANLLRNRSKVREYYSQTSVTPAGIVQVNNEDDFLVQLQTVISDHLEDTGLDVKTLAQYMCMSKPTLYRKITSISDFTPNELINAARLKRAAELLTEGRYKIYEITHMVGFNSQTNFGRSFLKQFGVTPTDYAKQQAERKGIASI